jgi:GT2 family glycosyltransferase
MDLSVIIINYKSATHVLNCVESIYKETSRHSFEVIVVDNNSGDESESSIRSAFPGIKWLQTGYNAGFARANNEGIRIAQGKHILILNADTIITENALDKAIELFEASDAVACGVQLLNTDGTTQISGAHFVKGGLNFLLPLPYLGSLVRWLGYKFNTRPPSVKNVEEKIEVDWIVGAFILVRKEVLERSGLMDEDFFMYAEEIEWCARLRKQGKLYLFSEPKVIHLGGGTSSDYYATDETENSKNLWNKKARQIIVSQMLRIRKQFGVLWFLVLLGFFLLELIIFPVCLLTEKIFRLGRSKYKWAHVEGYYNNVFSLLKWVPGIMMNKNYFYKVY